MIAAYYHPGFAAPIGEHMMPMRKFALVAEGLRTMPGFRLVEPRPATEEELGRVVPVAEHLDRLDGDHALAHGLVEERQECLHLVGGVHDFDHDGQSDLLLQSALEKLRTIFVRRGVTLTTSLRPFGGAVSAYSVQSAPAGLAWSHRCVTA